MIDYLSCSVCGKSYSPEAVAYVCPADGGNLTVHLDFESHPKALDPCQILHHADPSIWRYAPLLPVEDPGFRGTPLHRVGCTPIYKLPNLRTSLGMPRLWIKDESCNPSASFKDRASAIVIAAAIQRKERLTVAASTGNAGAAMACMAAATQQKCLILAPRTAPAAKVAQLLSFGAKVVLVNGSYDDAFELSLKASEAFGWYNRNTGYNYLTAEGKKTAAFEIWEHFKQLEKADAGELTIFIPVGDGNILSGIWKGFKDLLALGWIQKMPRLIGVQAEGSSAIADAFAKGSNTINPVHANTIADSISVDLPRDGMRALQAVRESGGYFITVSDAKILEAIPELGKNGVFPEPAAAAAFAGLRQALQSGYNPATPSLIMVTGSGLKDINAAKQAVSPAPIIEPSLKSLKEVMNRD